MSRNTDRSTRTEKTKAAKSEKSDKDRKDKATRNKSEKSDKDRTDKGREDKTTRTDRNKEEKNKEERGTRSDKDRSEKRKEERNNKEERKDESRSNKEEINIDTSSDHEVNVIEIQSTNIKNENNYHDVKNIYEYLKYRNVGLVVVKYSTVWCGPCKNFAPIFKRLAEEYRDVTFLSVDAEEIDHKDCEVSVVPSFKIILNGDIRRDFHGTDADVIRKYIERYNIQILYNGQLVRSFNEEMFSKINNYMKTFSV